MHGSYPALISQWMVNGSLRTYMEKFPNASIIRMVIKYSLLPLMIGNLLFLHEGDRKCRRSTLPSQSRRYSLRFEECKSFYLLCGIMCLKHTVFELGQYLDFEFWRAIIGRLRDITLHDKHVHGEHDDRSKRLRTLDGYRTPHSSSK